MVRGLDCAEGLYFPYPHNGHVSESLSLNVLGSFQFPFNSLCLLNKHSAISNGINKESLMSSMDKIKLYSAYLCELWEVQCSVSALIQVVSILIKEQKTLEISAGQDASVGKETVNLSG